MRGYRAGMRNKRLDCANCGRRNMYARPSNARYCKECSKRIQHERKINCSRKWNLIHRKEGLRTHFFNVESSGSLCGKIDQHQAIDMFFVTIVPANVTCKDCKKKMGSQI